MHRLSSSRRHLLKLAGGASLAGLSQLAYAAPDKPIITLYSRGDSTSRYAITLIEMAMHKAQAPFTLNIQQASKPAIAMRRLLKAGDIDLLWAATSQHLETEFIPVRIPLYKGLMGYRALLINGEKQAQFDRVDSLETLKPFTLGQVHSWADTEILQSNGLNLLRVTRHVSLFNKLKKGAVDAVPRALFEAIREQRRYPEFSVEQNLLLHYPMPMYFFVNKAKPELAHQLTYGLSKAVRDGSLEVLLYRQEAIKQAIDEIRRQKRRLITLKNPHLPAETPLDNPHLWLDLPSLQAQKKAP